MLTIRYSIPLFGLFCPSQGAVLQDQLKEVAIRQSKMPVFFFGGGGVPTHGQQFKLHFNRKFQLVTCMKKMSKYLFFLYHSNIK